jgi:hypothetical protein
MPSIVEAPGSDERGRDGLAGVTSNSGVGAGDTSSVYDSLETRTRSRIAVVIGVVFALLAVCRGPP